MSKVNLVPVVSSMIAAIGYSSRTQGLTVVFNSGEKYAYVNVPATVYANLMAAPSHGKFFNANIRNNKQYAYVNVAEARN